MRIDWISAPILPATAIDHDLEVEVWCVLRRVARRPDKSEYVSLTDFHPLDESFLVAIEVGVIVDETFVGIELINRYATGVVLPEPENGAGSGRDDGSPSGRHDVPRVMRAATTGRCIRGADAGTVDAFDRDNEPPGSQRSLGGKRLVDVPTADAPVGGELRLLFSGNVCVTVRHVDGRSRVAVEEGGTGVGGDRL